MKLDLEAFLNWLLANSPEFLADFIEVAEKFLEEYTKGIELPEGTGKGPRNWLKNPDIGYDLTTVSLSDEQISTIRQGIADGTINERAAAFLKGFLIAIKVATG
jgi:hypothetical protein